MFTRCTCSFAITTQYRQIDLNGKQHQHRRCWTHTNGAGALWPIFGNLGLLYCNAVLRVSTPPRFSLSSCVVHASLLLPLSCSAPKCRNFFWEDGKTQNSRWNAHTRTHTGKRFVNVRYLDKISQRYPQMKYYDFLDCMASHLKLLRLLVTCLLWFSAIFVKY